MRASVASSRTPMLLLAMLLLALHFSEALEAVQCPAFNGVPCNGIGSCDASAKCTCTAGYGGVSCEIKCATDAMLRPCSGHGRCTNAGVGGAECACEDGFAGPACGEGCPTFNGVVCSGRGTCWSDSRQAYCRCEAGDGRMFAAYDGRACEKSIYNPSTSLGNQTSSAEQSESHQKVALRAVAVVPVIFALLMIWMLLSFRDDWRSQYTAVLNDLYRDASSSWSNAHVDAIRLPHLHLREDKPSTPHALPRGASTVEVDAHTRALFKTKLAPRIEKYYKELEAEEMALRGQYEKWKRPADVPKRVWKNEHMSKQNAIYSRAEVLNKEVIAEGLRLLDLDPNLPNPSLSRLHRQCQAVRSQGDEGQFMRLLSGHGAFEPAGEPREGTKDDQNKLRRLSYDEFRLWVLEALRLVRHRQRKHAVEDWRQTAARAMKSDRHLPRDLQRRMRAYAETGSMVQRTAEQTAAANVLDNWAHVELYEEMARQGAIDSASSPYSRPGRLQEGDEKAAVGKMSADEADEAEAQTIFQSCLTGSSQEPLAGFSSSSRVPVHRLEARLTDMGLSSSETAQVLLEADHGWEGSVTYEGLRHALLPLLRQRHG